MRDTAENIIDRVLEDTAGDCDAVTIIDILKEGGYEIVEAGRLEELERKNQNLGCLANGGVPEGYSLVKEEL